mmetsp:Transcript_14318/g.23813  ORF Transcript_14318/g.23813 Transcript_14318/m.23813 type:complete len:157 (-) Transcript_14318:135-605(-)
MAQHQLKVYNFYSHFNEYYCKMKRTSVSVKEKVENVERFKRSGQTQVAFAAQNNVNVVNLCRWIKDYTSNKEAAPASKRKKQGYFVDVENKLVQYIQLQLQRYSKDNCGLSYLILKAKAIQFAEEVGCEKEFSASNGWIENVLRRHGLRYSRSRGR